MPLECPVCAHEHDSDGTCFCACMAEQDLNELCWSCGHQDHGERPCSCGCEG